MCPSKQGKLVPAIQKCIIALTGVWIIISLRQCEKILVYLAVAQRATHMQ